MNGDAPAQKPPRRRHFFVYPWPGAVDLYNISAVCVDQSRVNVQLYGGGFQRSAFHDDAPGIVNQMLDVLESLEGVEVTRYEQSGTCERRYSTEGCETGRTSAKAPS